jgi:hypothetical protein
MYKARSEMARAIDQAKALDIVVPAKLLRRLQIWPNDSAATWNSFVDFDQQNKLGCDLKSLMKKLSQIVLQD